MKAQHVLEGLLVVTIIHVVCVGAPRRAGTEVPDMRTTAQTICEQPTPSPNQQVPLCKVPIPDDQCGWTFVVEVGATGNPGVAYAEEYRSAALDACLTAGVRGWSFAPARDCGGHSVASLWKERYARPCDIPGAPIKATLPPPTLATLAPKP